MKLSGLAAAAPLVLLLLQHAFPAFTVHIRHPWSDDPVRSSLPVHIIAPALGPGFPGSSMRSEHVDKWYSHTWPNTSYPSNSDFYFASYIPTQFNTTANPAYYYGTPATFNFSLFPPGTQEIWIIPDSNGTYKVYADPAYYEGGKVALFFNPWFEHAAMAKVNGDSVYYGMPLSPDRQRCGWQRVNFPDSAQTVLFKTTHGSETYGSGGLGSGTAINLASWFTTSDTVFIGPDPFPAGAPKMSTTFPAGFHGICILQLGMTVRDFSKHHPDFEPGGRAGDDSPRKGMVAAALGPDRKPVKGPTPDPAYQSRFETWFRTDSTHQDSTLRNYETCRDLPMSRRKDGRWDFDSYASSSHSFFPIDDFNPFGETSRSMYVDATGMFRPDPTGGAHNFHFCMELHAKFVHKAGHTFDLQGDDDIWVFVDGKLAMDLGGIHTPVKGTIDFDALGLQPGQTYPFDLFYCERQTEGSDLHIKTSLVFIQSPEYIAKAQSTGQGPVTFSLLDIFQEGVRCGPRPAPSKIQLQGPGLGDSLFLNPGTSYGGITVDSERTQFTLDTAKMVGLAPGSYIITHTSDRTGMTGTVTFVLPGPVALGRSMDRNAFLKARMRGNQVLVQFQPGAGTVEDAVLTVSTVNGTALHRKPLRGPSFNEVLDVAGLGRGVRLVTVTAGNRRWNLSLAIP